jgi:4-hydroxy-tetrahydrodipicolinate synthase
MLMPPFFLGTPLRDIIAHIHAVASAVSIPIVIQYAPLQTGRVIDAPTFASICRDLPNINRVKVDLVSSGRTVSALTTNRVSSLVGYMGLHLPEDFTRGADGVMPTVSIAPAMVKIWQLLDNQHEEAKELHAHILPFLNFVMQSVEFLIACEKELLVEAGILGCAVCASQHTSWMRHSVPSFNGTKDASGQLCSKTDWRKSSSRGYDCPAGKVILCRSPAIHSGTPSLRKLPR